MPQNVGDTVQLQILVCRRSVVPPFEEDSNTDTKPPCPDFLRPCDPREKQVAKFVYMKQEEQRSGGTVCDMRPGGSPHLQPV